MSFLDALTTANIVHNINASSREELLSFIMSLYDRQIKWMIFNLVMVSHPASLSYINTKFTFSENELNQLYNHTLHCFNKKNINAITCDTPNLSPNRSCSFNQLPLDIGAYIVSYSTMKDRLRQQLISKDFYKFCQIPMAKYHLVIDRAFVKSIHERTMDYRKFCNAHYLEIKYVFTNTPQSISRYGNLCGLYYAIISCILANSPSLNTLKFNLSWHRFSSHLNSPPSGATNDTGHLLEWIQNIKDDAYSHENVFDGVTKLVWTPTQSSYNIWTQNAFETKHDLFIQFLPNLQSICIPKIRVNSGLRTLWTAGTRVDFIDSEWHLFKQSYYHASLKHIDIDMMNNRHYVTRGQFLGYRHVAIDNHPLSHFYKFKCLETMKLVLPIFDQSERYYAQLWMNNKAKKYMNRKCQHLRQISIEFKLTGLTGVTGRRTNTACVNCYGSLMNKICKYILSFAPHLSDYTMITENVKHNTSYFDVFVGFYYGLESLHINSFNILPPRSRFVCLKRLRLQLKHHEKLETALSLMDITCFPQLESIQCDYINLSSKPYRDFNENVISFMSYVLKQKSDTIKYIGLHHKPLQIKPKRIVKHPRKIESFDMRYCNKNQSLQICKMIVSLATNCNIQNIQLNPVSLTQKELNYLSFWFSGEFGHINANKKRSIQSGLILTDLFCAQSIDISQ